MWKTTNQQTQYVRLFKNKQLNSGATGTFNCPLPDWLEWVYWFYAIPSETQSNYPQEVSIESVKVKVVDHAKFEFNITVKNSANVGTCKFDVWAARVLIP